MILKRRGAGKRIDELFLRYFNGKRVLIVFGLKLMSWILTKNVYAWNHNATNTDRVWLSFTGSRLVVGLIFAAFKLRKNRHIGKKTVSSFEWDSNRIFVDNSTFWNPISSSFLTNNLIELIKYKSITFECWPLILTLLLLSVDLLLRLTFNFLCLLSNFAI